MVHPSDMNGEDYMSLEEYVQNTTEFNAILLANWTADEIAYAATLQQQAAYDEADMWQEGWENEDG